jgi:hypothetical protein
LALLQQLVAAVVEIIPMAPVKVAEVVEVEPVQAPDKILLIEVKELKDRDIQEDTVAILLAIGYPVVVAVGLE